MFTVEYHAVQTVLRNGQKVTISKRDTIEQLVNVSFEMPLTYRLQ